MNSPARFFLDPAEWNKAEPALFDDEARHCSSVLRKKAGDVIEVFDGLGNRAEAKLVNVDRKRCTIALGEPREASVESTAALSLAVAIPKGKTMDLIVQKAVELGVGRIQPLMTENVVVRLNAAEARRKTEKWQRVALEACKQCGQDRLPEIGVPCPIQDWFGDEKHSGDYKIIASLESEAISFASCFANQSITGRDALLLVGPEGDFSRSETELAFELGFQPVSLGEIVMRVETAVFYAASIIRFAQGA